MTEGGTLEGRVEAILFVAGEPVRVEELARALEVTPLEIETALDKLRDDYDFNQRGFMLRRFGHQVQLATRALYADDVVRMLQPVQPVTKAEIEQIRGVKCDYSVQSLMTKNLITEVGRKEALGRPILYGTTEEFLSHFGISSLSELPPMPKEADDDAAGAAEEMLP